MRFARLDHIVLQVPGIEEAHARLLSLGFAEAWPIGRTWTYGRTSGVALGGINLELLQPDEEPPDRPALAEIVFEPLPQVPLETYGRVVEKVESDSLKLIARGFSPAAADTPQRICTNAFPGADSPWPHFVCQYAPLLAHRLAAESYPTPYGIVRRVTIGPLRSHPRFVDPPTRADLVQFLTMTSVKTGARLASGEDGVEFWSGGVLNLSRLTIEASDRAISS